MTVSRHMGNSLQFYTWWFGKTKLPNKVQLIFYFIIYIIQFYDQDCTILQICWAVRLWFSQVLSK